MLRSLATSPAAACRLVTRHSEVGGVRGLAHSLTSQQSSSSQVQLGAASRDCPESESDSQVQPSEWSSPWWWEEFRSFLLEGIADISCSQEGGSLEGSANVSELPEVCECVCGTESERASTNISIIMIMSVDRSASTWRR